MKKIVFSFAMAYWAYGDLLLGMEARLACPTHSSFDDGLSFLNEGVLFDLLEKQHVEYQLFRHNPVRKKSLNSN